ncbi:MAG: DUF6077 domain-containing protein [Bacilli bacterium]
MNIILFLLSFLAISIFLGIFMNSFLKISSTFSFTYLIGFITLFASFELIALPFMLLHGNFNLLVIIYGLFLTISFIFFIIKFRTKFSKQNLILPKKKFSILWLIFGVLLIFQVIIVTIFAHYDADDSFFIAISNTILHTNQIFTIDPSSGLENTSFPLQYILTGYEIIIAFFAKLFMLKPIVIFHTLLPIILVPTSYIAFYHLSTNLMKEKYRPLFLIFISILNLFSNYSAYSPGSFLLFRSWQGKASLVNILLPFLLSVFIVVISNHTKKRNQSLILISLILIASVCFSTVGLYLLPIAYFCLVLGHLIFSKDKKNIFNIIIAAIPSFLFLMLFLMIIFKNNGLSSLTNITYTYSFINELAKFFNNHYLILILYLIACIFLWFKGSKAEKFIFCFYPIFLFLTFLNPLLMPFIAKYLTGAPVYWRLFWLLPIYPTIALALIKFYCQYKINQIYKSLISCCLLIPMLLPQNFIFNPSNYTFTGNLEKIPQNIITVCEITEQNIANPIIISPPDYVVFIRQYSSNIKLVWSRVSEINKNNSDQFNKLCAINTSLYEKNIAISKKDLELFNINALILNKNSVNENISSYKYSLNNDNFSLLLLK